MRIAAAFAAAGLAALAGCAGAMGQTRAPVAAAGSGAPALAADPAVPRFWRAAGLPLGRPAREQLVNVDGSLRVTDAAGWERFWGEVAPRVREWSRDPRLDLNPNYVAAILTKESGFEPFATSWVPANGYPQLTHIADLDLRQIVSRVPAWRWMEPEVRSWPRHAAIHTPDATKARTDSLVAEGIVTPDVEYFFDPVPATRAGMFWLRLLADAWQGGEWAGDQGAAARRALNDGRPLTESQLLDLVTVSYNQGYPYVRDLLDRFGTGWTEQLNEEAANYLERVRFYTVVYQRASGAG